MLIDIFMQLSRFIKLKFNKMKKIVILFFVLLLHGSVYSQWIPGTSGTTNFLTCLESITATVNYAGGFSGTFLKSSNFGQTWTAGTNPTGSNINKISFPPTGNATTGWAATVAGLFKTTNSGQNWVQQGPNGVMVDVLFPNVTTGYVLMNALQFLKTTNGGTNFSTVNLPNTGGIGGNSFIRANSSVLFILGVDNGDDTSHIFKSTDDGATWNKVFRVHEVYFSMNFINASTGIICGDNGIIRRTTNGGNNWTLINSGTTFDLQGVKFASSTLVYIVGSGGTILRSTDAGLTWGAQTSGVTLALRGVAMLSTGDNGIICGASGTILRTTNGGLTPVIQQWNEVPDTYMLSQNYPNPFNPATKIKFALPTEGIVELKVYNIFGEETMTLVTGVRKAGSYEVELDAGNLASGVYFYKLKVNDFSETKKMILLR
jgi:photosystem II stability/assembly factor-like uncharacterized protein